MTGQADVVRPTTSGGAGADPGGLAELADRLVAAVCRPADVDEVRAAVAEASPGDLAGLVAAVDGHQPMTLEVVVDVLAELGVRPTAVAEAMAVDVEDVVAMLGGPLGDPPAPRVATDARIIEVVRPADAHPAPTDGDEDVPGPPSTDADPAEPAPATGGVDDRPDTAPDSTPDIGDGAPAVAVRIDEVAADGAVTRTVADPEDEPGPRRSRWWWLLALLVVVAAAVVAALLAGWP